MLSIRDVREYVSALQLEDRDPRGFRAMVVIVSSLAVGTKPPDLARFTGYTADEIAPMVERLRRAGIFNDSEILVDLFGEDHATGLMLYAAVAVGDMLYNPETKMFRLSEQGKRLAETLITGATQ